MTGGHGTGAVAWAFQNRTNPRQADQAVAISSAATLARAPRGYCGFGTVAGDSGTGSSAVALGGALFCPSFAGGISVPLG